MDAKNDVFYWGHSGVGFHGSGVLPKTARTLLPLVLSCPSRLPNVCYGDSEKTLEKLKRSSGLAACVSVLNKKLFILNVS